MFFFRIFLSLLTQFHEFPHPGSLTASRPEDGVSFYMYKINFSFKKLALFVCVSIPMILSSHWFLVAPHFNVYFTCDRFGKCKCYKINNDAIEPNGNEEIGANKKLFYLLLNFIFFAFRKSLWLRCFSLQNEGVWCVPPRQHMI